MTARIRIVIAELVAEASPEAPIDGHGHGHDHDHDYDRGAEALAHALRDAGIEIVYVGRHQTPEKIVRTVVQEDADAVGLSVRSGSPVDFFRRTVELLAEEDASDVILFGDGIIDAASVAEFEMSGVAMMFAVSATMDDILDWVGINVVARPQA